MQTKTRTEPLKVESMNILFYRYSRPVIVQSLSGHTEPLCIQYGGSGRYFRTTDDLNAYLKKRFGAKPVEDYKLIPCVPSLISPGTKIQIKH